MIINTPACRRATITAANRLWLLPLAAGLTLLGCAGSSQSEMAGPAPSMATARPPSPDPRIGLRAGLFDAQEAAWNLRVVSKTPPPEDFVGVTNSDLAFKGNYAIQGNYNGIQVWDISNPSQPSLVIGYVCPASQSDVSVYGNLLFVSGEGLGGRLDCGTEGVREAVSDVRLRGIRIFLSGVMMKRTIVFITDIWKTGITITILVSLIKKFVFCIQRNIRRKQDLCRGLGKTYQ